MNIYNFFSILFVFFSFAFVLVPITSAFDKTAVNSGNGPGSLNSAVVTSFENIVTEQNNSNRLKNVVIENASSGDNMIKGNNGSAAIETGEAEAIANITNISNKNILEISCSCNNVDQAKNVDNGANSVNIAAADSVNTKSSLQNNENNTGNLSMSSSKSGANWLINNNGDIKIKNGKVKTLSNTLNVSNLNIIRILP